MQKKTRKLRIVISVKEQLFVGVFPEQFIAHVYMGAFQSVTQVYGSVRVAGVYGSSILENGSRWEGAGAQFLYSWSTHQLMRSTERALDE